MKKGLVVLLFSVSFTTLSEAVFAWGKTGHELVGKIAYYFLDGPTRELVKKYLGNISFEEAANWMDDERSNSYYNYMRTWHYLDIDKGKEYDKTSTERNILTILHSAITDLREYKTNKRKDIKRDLLLIFHLVGDLHQPLHTGYAIDKGGNAVDITSGILSGNLHSIWDSQILEYKNINIDSCLQLYPLLDTLEVAEIKKINELKWMYQSRTYLDWVYSFKDNRLDETYIDSSSKIIKKQLLLAGIRLASIIKDCLGTSVTTDAAISDPGFDWPSLYNANAGKDSGRLINIFPVSGNNHYLFIRKKRQVFKA